MDEIEGKIEVDEYRGNVVIYVDEVDEKLFHNTDGLGGWYLKNNVIFVVKTTSHESANINVLIHENQHSENKIFLDDMYEKNNKNLDVVSLEILNVLRDIGEKLVQNGGKNYSNEDRKKIWRSWNIFLKKSLLLKWRGILFDLKMKFWLK